jgi:arsenate reductase-like glutaredoxin family protein
LDNSYYVVKAMRARLWGHANKGGIMEKEIGYLVTKMDRDELVRFLRLVRQALYRQAMREPSRSGASAQAQEASRKGSRSRV